MKKDVYLVNALRTPFGKYKGALRNVTAISLAVPVIRKLVEDTNISPTDVAHVIIGQVLQVGCGQNPARQAAIFAKLPKITRAETVNKVCNSSLYAAELASLFIETGRENVVIAGGMESMSNAPDPFMIHDGLTDAYVSAELGHMGKLADVCAREFNVSRKEQDEYALCSYDMARAAQNAVSSRNQVVPVSLPRSQYEKLYCDEIVFDEHKKPFSELSPVFDERGTITAGNASKLSDGAAAMLMVSEDAVKKYHLTPLARIVSFATYSWLPRKYVTAPVGAINKVLEVSGLQPSDIDLFEVNEAFAVVPILVMRRFNIPRDKINKWGGAIAMGHPLGASGARIFGNLAHMLRHTGGRYGIASACNGGGEAMAVLIENTGGKKR